MVYKEVAESKDGSMNFPMNMISNCGGMLDSLLVNIYHLLIDLDLEHDF